MLETPGSSAHLDVFLVVADTGIHHILGAGLGPAIIQCYNNESLSRKVFNGLQLFLSIPQSPEELTLDCFYLHSPAQRSKPQGLGPLECA